MFFFPIRRRHKGYGRDWCSDVCASDLTLFFIQAEDGIRDIGVPGVQACALAVALSEGTLPDTGKFPSESAHSRAVRGLSAYRPHTARPWSARGGVEEAWPSESRRKGGGVSFRSAGGARPPVGRPIVLPRWSRYVIPVLGSVVVLIVLISVGAGIWTDFLWFRSVGYTSVFDTTYGVRWALFAITAFFMMAVI